MSVWAWNSADGSRIARWDRENGRRAPADRAGEEGKVELSRAIPGGKFGKGGGGVVRGVGSKQRTSGGRGELGRGGWSEIAIRSGREGESSGNSGLGDGSCQRGGVIAEVRGEEAGEEGHSGRG